MYAKLNEPLVVHLAEDSTIPEAVKYRASLARRRADPDADEDEATSDVHVVPVPSHIVICSTCSGHGKSSAYLGAFSGQRLQEAREDEDFWEAYVSGQLDRSCETCDGKGRLLAPDESRCSKELLKAINEQDEDDAYAAAEQRAERLMEGGWREEGWYD